MLSEAESWLAKFGDPERKKSPLSEIKDDLSRCLRDADTGDRHGKPAGVLIGFESAEDWFECCLEHDPRSLQRDEQERNSLRAGRGVKA